MIEKLEPLTEVDAKNNPIATHMPDSTTLMCKINELVDAVNTIQKEREAERFEIQEWIGILEAVRKSVNIHEKQIDELQMKVEPEKCETPAENVQDRMIGCETLDIPESYIKSCRMDKEFAEEEYKRLQDEIIRTRKALDVAVDALKRIADAPIGYCMFAEEALEQITALEQKDK